MANYWLAKQEPSGPRGYNFEQLKKEKTTVWDGVHNNLALKHMREMNSGDLVLFYHTGDERQAVGIMQITSKPYSNPKEDAERFIVVDVKYKKSLKRPVTLDEMKKEKKFTAVYHDLDHLFGTWSDKELEKIQGKINSERNIDPELWK